jgi:glycosyltransferase involved in cell wall biosynthesis
VSLAEAGYEVYLLASAPEDGQIEGVRIVALPVFRSRLRRMLLGPLAVLRALLRLRPDLVHVHDPELIPLAIAWRLVRRTPTVYDSHEDLSKQVLGKPYVKPWLRPVFVRLARTVEAAADRFLDAVVAAEPLIAGNYRRAPVFLVQNFPWLRDFPESSPVDLASRSVIYVGGIAEGRGAREMLEAVEQSETGARLRLAGPIMSPALRGEIERRDAVVEYLGYLPASDIPRLLNASSVGLVVLHPLPKYLEAQPTKLFEYMAAGRPFIASDFPSWRRLLGEINCGVFIDPKDVSALRAAIDYFLTHPEEAAAMGLRGRVAFEERFTFETQVAHLLKLVETLVR